jgi:periplasmic protein TonB
MKPGRGIRRVLLPPGAGLRRAMIISFAIHLTALGAVAVLARPRYVVPKPMNVIPVSLVGFAAPPPGQMVREKPQAAAPSLPKPVAPKPKEKTPEPAVSLNKTRPPKAPEPKAKSREDDKPRPKTGSADTTRVAPSQLPAVGNLRGWMQVQVDGPVLAYSYYLQVVQQKIASYWEPPAGLEQGGHEIAAMLWFRIERDGRLANRYVEEPSGSNLFDTSALRALALAAPLPPLPADYPGDYLILHLRFVYAR